MQAETCGVTTPFPVRSGIFDPVDTQGLAALARLAMDPAGLGEAWEALVARVSSNPFDAGALMDMSVLLQATGQRERGLELQAGAARLRRCFRRGPAGEPGLRLLAFATAGDFMANTPLDFLLEGSEVELVTCYVDEGLPRPGDLPAHDLAFLAIGQSEASAPLLASLEPGLKAWPVPVLNVRPGAISALTRDGVAARFAGHPHVLCPPVRRTDRAALAAVAAGERPSASLAEGLAFPLVVRPLDTHAGGGMERIADQAELGAYLAARAEDAFFVTAFVDYAGLDGLFRKLRIAFIDGRPFIAHMAVSERWMVHYLNAGMDQSEAKRAEEAAMMAGFDDGFAARHADAFDALVDAFGLDYFGIDCAEAPDGRLLLFEADVAMIIHAMDGEDLYPYKKPAMRKLFSAFTAALQAHAPAAGVRRSA